ncbi:unnamed protein product, partial [Prorocentrum cordatum]
EVERRRAAPELKGRSQAASRQQLSQDQPVSWIDFTSLDQAGGGGGEVAGRLVRDGEAQLGDLRPFVGFSGWAALQLELELQRGVWVRARAPDRPQPLWAPTPLALGQQPGGPCWRACLRASGMRALSLVPRGGEAGDASLRRRVEAHSLAQVQEMVDAHAQASA